jgi:hypothetical protein
MGMVAGVALTILGLVLLGQHTNQAGAAALSEKTVAGFQTTEKLIVTISLSNPQAKKLQGTLRLELLGPKGQSLVEKKQDVNQTDATASYRFDLPATKTAPDQLTLRCQFGKQQVEVPLSRVLVVKAHETSVASSQQFIAGSPATIRCEVHGVKSITENIPLAGATVDIRLRAKDDKGLPLATGKTGADGVAEVQFKVPDVSAGTYTLEIGTRSALGEEKLQHQVQVKSDAKILLVTDKPLYQPGQVIHIRALALRSFDLKPVADSPLLFEVEDAKGNKVFKREYRTSEYGVASVDFQLADEVNMGDYRVRALLGQHQADKTVAVKRYVLPKFKTELTADKRFYLPKETLHAELQADYFFGKPVANSKIKVTASTFDVQFKEFQTWEGKTDAHGHAKFDIKLPDYFVGQPLQKGDAFVRLEAKVTDTADHSETIQRSYTVSDQPIRVSLIPESGRLVPGMENRIYAAAIYPDGSPAVCEVNLWVGKQAKDKPIATVKTNEAGLAEFTLTPKPEQFRQGQWEQRNVEMLGGQNPVIGGPKILFDLFAEAKDDKGNAARTTAEVNSDPLGENILLRLDKAIYRGGDTLQVEVRSSAGLPTVYLDVIKGGQTLLTRWMDVKDGKASQRLDLPPELFGTLEVHAYQTLSTGEIIRDSRVVYVHPREDLKVEVKADKDVHLPGETGRIHFRVTDTAGKPTAAALGVLIVDEAVYALQEMQPGLEKVYFTLQEELLKPKTQIVYRPRESFDTLVREPELGADKQQIAQVLLTAAKPKPPARWQVSPDFERRQKVQGQVQQIGWALFNYAISNKGPVLAYDKAAKRWDFKPGLIKDLLQARYLNDATLNDPLGGKWTLADVAKMEKNFSADQLARAITLNRMQQVYWVFIQHANVNQAKWLKDGKWTYPDTALADAVKRQGWQEMWMKDAWGRSIKLVKRDKKAEQPNVPPQFQYYELVSAGPDGKLGTADDVKLDQPNNWQLAQGWNWFGLDPNMDFGANNLGWATRGGGGFQGRFGGRGGMLMLGDGADRRLGALGGAGGMMPAGAAAAPMQLNLQMDRRAPEKAAAKGQLVEKLAEASAGEGSAAPVTRVREYFPETMFWQPALITDDKGVAVLPLTFADSITSWRLTASANSKGGILGGVTAPLRVFQDFFVDLDLPVSLTQNDEVAFPVAVYNYLKTPQTVKLELQRESWFDLLDEAGFTRSLDLQPNEVTSIKFRLRARKIGFQPLTVKATGSKMSDAIKRTIEVVPDGTKVEQVVTDRLSGKVTQTVDIPAHAIPDASKILVKLYPGVFSQVMEGMEGMMRMPFG